MDPGLDPKALGAILVERHDLRDPVKRKAFMDKALTTDDKHWRAVQNLIFLHGDVPLSESIDAWIEEADSFRAARDEEEATRAQRTKAQLEKDFPTRGTPEDIRAQAVRAQEAMADASFLGLED